MRNLQQIQEAGGLSITDLHEACSPSLPDGVRAEEEGEPEAASARRVRALVARAFPRREQRDGPELDLVGLAWLGAWPCVRGDTDANGGRTGSRRAARAEAPRSSRRRSITQIGDPTNGPITDGPRNGR